MKNVCEALEDAGLSASSVYWCSLNSPVEWPLWMSEEGYRNLRNTTTQTLWQSVTPFSVHLHGSCRRQLCSFIRALPEVQAIPDEKEKDKAVDSCIADLSSAIRSAIHTSEWDCIHTTLVYFLGFIILGDHQAAARLEKLVSILPHFLPARQLCDGHSAVLTA